MTDAATALIRGLRRAGYEPQLTLALASVFRAEQTVGAEFVRLLLKTVGQAERVAQVPAELDCAAEEIVEEGRVDLRFRSGDWDVIVELKIHAGYGPGWLERYLSEVVPAEHGYVLAVTRDVPVGEPPPRPEDRWLGAVRWRDIVGGLRQLPIRDPKLAAQWPLFLEVLETEGSMGFTRPQPELFDAFANSGKVMRHMADFLLAVEGPLLDALVAELGGKAGAAALYKPGQLYWERSGKVDIPFRVPADGPGRIRAGLIGSVPPTTFFVQAVLGRLRDVAPVSEPAVAKLKNGSFKFRHLRAKLPLDAGTLTEGDLEKRVVEWARDRFREIIDSGLLTDPLPGAPIDLLDADETEAD